MNSTENVAQPSNPAPAGLPAADGSPVWKVGDDARIATNNNCRWVQILAIRHGTATVLEESGYVQYWSIGSLQTRESYLRACKRMRDEWTVAHYRYMIELADRPFMKPPKWAEWVARATGQENT